MPIPSPFHPRTQALCESYRWKDWAGYHAVCSYGHSHEKEYFAFREAAGLLDISPLFKYQVHGPDAQVLLCRMMARDIAQLAVGRVSYCCWCDDKGKVIDDGTVTRLDENAYLVTAAEPSYHWLHQLGQSLNVEIEDCSAELAALALQGPTSRNILQACTDGVNQLEFFSITQCKLDGVQVWITRTGYTGDLGYEIWCPREQALAVWDAIMAAGQGWGIRPAGLDALDMTRIEAGFIMLGVDYFSAPKVVTESRKSSPYELGLGWTVQLEREPFVGQAALRREKAKGAWKMVGLELSWEELEALYESYGLPPSLPAMAQRNPLPVFSGQRQVGQATSHTWSPILKKGIALASVRTAHATKGYQLGIEHTVEFERRQVNATVVPTPFFNPERKIQP